MSLFDVAGDIGGLFSQVLNPFGLPSKGAWNLQQGKFITSDGLAVYEYPYIDGQALKDLGRKGEKFVMNIKFFGDNYQGLFKDFIDTVAKGNKKGTLIHPV